MQDDRLSDLAVLFIEIAEARKLDVRKIIDDFASGMGRQMILTVTKTLSINLSRILFV